MVKSTVETLVVPLLAMAALDALTLDEVVELAREGVNLEKKATIHTKAHKLSFASMAKVIVQLKRRYYKAVDSGAVTSTTSFPDYFQNNTGGKPNNHAESCAKTYAAFVDGGFISEKQFDDCKTDYIEKAAPIVSDLKGELKNPDGTPKAETLEVALILSTRPKDAKERLVAIHERLAGRKLLSHEKAVEYLRRLFQDGHLSLALHTAAAEIAHTEDTETAREAFFASYQVSDAFARNTNIPAETQIEWATEAEAERAKREAAKAPVGIQQPQAA